MFLENSNKILNEFLFGKKTDYSLCHQKNKDLVTDFQNDINTHCKVHLTNYSASKHPEKLQHELAYYNCMYKVYSKHINILENFIETIKQDDNKFYHCRDMFISVLKFLESEKRKMVHYAKEVEHEINMNKDF